jgi:hypothetical protein
MYEMEGPQPQPHNARVPLDNTRVLSLGRRAARPVTDSETRTKRRLPGPSHVPEVAPGARYPFR